MLSARPAASPVGRCDPELERVRCLLAALRPDCADPLSPPPEEQTTPSVLGRSDPMATWGGTPRGLGVTMPTPPSITAAMVVRELAALPPEARVVLFWLRDHGRLGDGPSEGVRGLYCDVALAFASEAQREAWRDLAARREGAHVHGRYLVFRAAEAWGR